MERSKNAVRSVDETLKQLKQTGLRVTDPRIEVVEEVHAREGMFTGEQLYDDLRAQGSGIGRATIFRTIDVLVDLEILDRVHQPDGAHGYVLRGPGHRHHMVCSGCGEVIEFQGCNVNELIEALSLQTNFRIEGHWLEIFGTCGRCQEPDSVNAD
jgi:Fur family transcriptional regulator, ferric uptake regulator